MLMVLQLVCTCTVYNVHVHATIPVLKAGHPGVLVIGRLCFWCSVLCLFFSSSLPLRLI